jgi:hypothetical protein
MVLTLYMDKPQTDDGYYLVKYPNSSPHSYTAVEYISTPMNRVFWFSPDSFLVVHFGQEIWTPIINYSTYTSSDSSGRQMIYLYEPFISDTLEIIGCIYSDNGELCKSLEFIIE